MQANLLAERSPLPLRYTRGSPQRFACLPGLAFAGRPYGRGGVRATPPRLQQEENSRKNGEAGTGVLSLLRLPFVASRFFVQKRLALKPPCGTLGATLRPSRTAGADFFFRKSPALSATGSGLRSCAKPLPLRFTLRRNPLWDASLHGVWLVACKTPVPASPAQVEDPSRDRLGGVARTPSSKDLRGTLRVLLGTHFVGRTPCFALRLKSGRSCFWGLCLFRTLKDIASLEFLCRCAPTGYRLLFCYANLTPFGCQRFASLTH